MKLPESGTKFVVLSGQRSGSSWLVSLLNQVEATTAFGELFLKRKKPTQETWDAGLELPRFPELRSGRGLRRPLELFSYLDGIYRRPGAVGFKLMYTQSQKYPEIPAYLFLRRIRVVHLIRRNQLDVLISRAIKNKTRRAHILAGDAPPEEVQVRINPEKLLGRIENRQKRIRSARRLLGWSTLPHMEVFYEDLLNGPQVFLQVCQFLKINPEGEFPASNLVKARRKGPEEVVSNYSEIKKVLNGTPYGHYVE